MYRVKQTKWNVWKNAFKSHSINNFSGQSYITISRLFFFRFVFWIPDNIISLLGITVFWPYYTIASITFAFYLHYIYGISNTILRIKSAHNGASALNHIAFCGDFITILLKFIQFPFMLRYFIFLVGFFWCVLMLLNV